MAKADKMKNEAIREWDKKINSLKESGNIEDSLILELGKTAIWLTKCAEYYKEKIAKTEDLEERKEYSVLIKAFYDLKLKIVKLLLKTNKVQIEFYKPRVRHKFNNLKMCEIHEKTFKNSNYSENLVAFLYQNNNFNEIYYCDECSYDLEKNFYCLYYFTIKIEDIRIMIQIPYEFLKDEEEVRKNSKIVSWKRCKEGIVFKNQDIFKNQAIFKRSIILKDISFSKQQLSQNFKELKLLLDNKKLNENELNISE